MPFTDLPQQQQYGGGFAVLEQLFQKLSITSLPSSPSPLMKSLLPAAPAAAAAAPAAAAPYIILIQHSLAKSLRLTKAGVMGESSSSNNKSMLGTTRKKNESAIVNTIANTTNNATDLLYRRAGLSTPAETASRDWVAGTLWLEQTIREYQQQQPNTFQTTTTSTAAPKTSSRLIWIQTTPSSLQPLPLMLNGDDDHNNVTIINASLDPWGWDHDDTDTAITPSVEYAATSPPHSHHRRPLANLDSLQSILAAVQFEIDNNNNSHSSGESIMVAFDSLTPLWTRHGFARVLRFLQNLSRISSSSSSSSHDTINNNDNNNCSSNFRMILLLPIVTESLTRKQHLQLEDELAHAVLWLQHARHGVFLKRGVRESDNLMRHELPFDIVVAQQQQQQQGGHGGGRSNTTSRSRLVLVPGLTIKNQEEEVGQDERSGIAGQQQRVVPAASIIAEPGGGVGVKTHQHQQTPLVGQPQQQGRSGGRTHVQLKLEHEGDAPRAQQATTVSASEATIQTQQPLIYLENDDPEFDDYDEEDPDDDLDI